jgi:acylphosphatase
MPPFFAGRGSLSALTRPGRSPVGWIVSGTVRRRVVARGHVQGVFFRDSVRREAGRRGVAGWARNRPDGAFEAVFEGDPDAVAEMVAFCERGPRGADVDRVETSDEEPEGLSGFEVR